MIEITWPAAQKKFEPMMVQQLLKDEKITRVLEIGTWIGGTALLWAMMVAPHNGIVYCCDLSFNWGTFWARDPVTGIITGWDCQFYSKSPYAKFIKEIQGDTHEHAYIERVKNTVGDPVDFMFIDGDHSYDGVRADFYNYASLVKSGGYIAFHDIVDSEHHRKYGCFVSQFWNEIKNQYDYWEFIDGNDYPGLGEGISPSKSMGIGVIKV